MFSYWAGHTHSAWMNFSIRCMEGVKMIAETEILHITDMHTQCGKLENLGVVVGIFDCHAERKGNNVRFQDCRHTRRESGNTARSENAL